MVSKGGANASGTGWGRRGSASSFGSSRSLRSLKAHPKANSREHLDAEPEHVLNAGQRPGRAMAVTDPGVGLVDMPALPPLQPMTPLHLMDAASDVGSTCSTRSYCATEEDVESPANPLRAKGKKSGLVHV